ncbi:hypothetical protein F8388_022688, partial [Cannabis sativa]
MIASFELILSTSSFANFYMQEIYSIKLPGDPKLGEGKPENQNHAIVFTRGEAVQTIDMNQQGSRISKSTPGTSDRATLGALRDKEQLRWVLHDQDNYLEEAMKMRNLLEEFHRNHGLRPPTILGVREHVFRGSVSSLAWLMSNQETSFVTLGQRVLASPLKKVISSAILDLRCRVELCLFALWGHHLTAFLEIILTPFGKPSGSFDKLSKKKKWTKRKEPKVDFPSNKLSEKKKETKRERAAWKRLERGEPLGKPEFRMHYGHPDVFDRVFHITRGGISKASRVINISEDIFAGGCEVGDCFLWFNSTLRQGNITHHEYIQVGKGRDVGLNQISLFEGKVAGGNGEQVLSRDVYRLGQLFDFFRMCSFFFTTVGFYVCSMVRFLYWFLFMTVLTVYIFLYGRVYLAFSGLDEQIAKQAKRLGSTALDATLNAQFLVQIGIFTAVPMIMGFIIELGLLKAVFSFITMQLQLCSVFFTFSLGTRTHYFGRTILHGGAKYRATGRGFVVYHIKFAENYRLYSRSHFVKAFEVALLLIVYIAYGYTAGGAVSFELLTMSSWFLVFSWLSAPFIFNPFAFNWRRAVEDFDDWTSWLLCKGGVGVKGDDSWESWWEEEL